jgi:hypothetical protein
MKLLEPDWNQPKPTWQDAQLMCARVPLAPLMVESTVIDDVLARLRVTHSNGGAVLASIQVGANDTFDWFASRNRLLEFDVLRSLLRRESIRDALPELMIPIEEASNGESDDGQLAARLFTGGAYGSSQKIEAKAAKRLAISFCDAVFQQRYGDVSLFSNYDAWTPWFHGIAWDWTAILFDRHDRRLSILAVTDTD